MKYIKIFEYPEQNKENFTTDIIYWNINKKNNSYILNQIDKNSKYLKKKIIEKLNDFHLNHFNNLNSINIKLDKNVNFWSCNSMFDNNIYSQPLINTYIKFEYLKQIIKKKKN